MKLVVVGDALLDRDIDGRCTRVTPDAPVPVV
jgi:D-beta-D-heptose 7-phosphate kinase/D-beta-D-heptose 1-phosphate adenosyltransferase